MIMVMATQKVKIDDEIRTKVSAGLNIAEANDLVGMQLTIMRYGEMLDEIDFGDSFGVDQIIEESLMSLKKQDSKLAQQVAAKIANGLKRYVEK